MIQGRIENHVRTKLIDEIKHDLFNRMHILSPKEILECVKDHSENTLYRICNNMHWGSANSLLNKVVEKLLPEAIKEFEHELFQMLLKQGEINFKNLEFGDSVNQTLSMLQKNIIDLENKISNLSKIIQDDRDLASQSINLINNRLDDMQSPVKKAEPKQK